MMTYLFEPARSTRFSGCLDFICIVYWLCRRLVLQVVSTFYKVAFIGVLLDFGASIANSFCNVVLSLVTNQIG